MKREIKFRGKRIDNGEWVYGLLIKHEKIAGIIPAYEIHYTDCGGALDFLYIEVDPTTVGQYTGLKDKIGTDIYEGDSLFVNRIGDYPLNQNHHVVYNRYFATFATDQDSTFDWVRYEGKYTVTGNIHNK